MSSFNSSENIRKKEVGPDRYVSNNKYVSVTLNKLTIKTIIMSSFKSSGDIQRKRVGQTAVSDNQSSSVTLNELANKARKYSVILNFSEEVIQ